MKFLDRADETWLELTLDSRMRAKRINELSHGRPIVFGCMIVGCVCFVAAIVSALMILNFTKQRSEGGMSFLFLMSLTCLSPCFTFFSMQRELRLLKLVDRLPVDNVPRTDPPVADAS